MTPVPGTRFAALGAGAVRRHALLQLRADRRGGRAAGGDRCRRRRDRDDAGAEVLEFPDHPFYVTSMFQPHIGALAGAPVHPLVLAFMDAVRSRGPCVRASRAAPRSVRRSIAPRTPDLDRPVDLRRPAGLADPRCGPRGGPGRRTAAVAAAVLRRGPAPVRRGRRGRGGGPRRAAGRRARSRPGHVRLPAARTRGCASTRSTSRPPVRGSGSGSPRRGSRCPDSVTYVGVDFERDDLMGRLVEVGFDPASPAELHVARRGAVPDPRGRRPRRLRAVATVPGAEVVFDYASRRHGQSRRPRAASSWRPASPAAGEPFSERWEPAGAAWHCSPSPASTTSRTSAAPRSARATSASTPARPAAVRTSSGRGASSLPGHPRR